MARFLLHAFLMLAILRFLTSGDSAAPLHAAVADERSGPPATAYAIASLLGAGLAVALAVAALAAVSRSQPQRFGAAVGASSTMAVSGRERTIACPSAYALVGARIFERDSMVSGIALLCSKSDDVSVPLLETETLGAASTNVALVRCSAEQAAVGLWGAAGARVDQLSLSCARRARPRAPVEHLRGVGGAGGRGFHARCPGALRGIRGAVADYVENVALLCEGPDA